MSEAAREPDRTAAEVRRSWWPGWIWAIPIAAVLLVGWWAGRTFMNGGQDITISFDDVHGLKSHNASVLYRGMQVGQVVGLKLAKDGNGVVVTVHIDDNAKEFLRTGTQFWLRGANPSLADMASLGSVLSGPTLMMAPGPGAATTHFVGMTEEPVVSGAHGPPQTYEVYLTGAVGGLKKGEPVKLSGFTIGEVSAIGFIYNDTTGEIATPVELAIYPSLFHIAARDADERATLRTEIDRLIQNGLQAKLERDPPLIGEPQVSLDIAKGGAKPALSDADGVPIIPAAPDGGVDSIVTRVNRLPIDEIGRNILDATRHADAIAASPQLADAVAQLDQTLKEIDATTSKAGPQIQALIARLGRTANQIDAAAKAAEGTAKSTDKMIGGAPNQNGLPEAMIEINRAARSVRDLANYLDEHPEALIQGRSGE